MAASILFFESDPDFAAAVRGALEARGASVEIVDDGNVGLAQATSSAPDLILLTIELPQMNGFLVCKKLKKNPATQSIPVVILSSEATEEIFEQHRKLRTRAEEYVRKPIDVDALLARVGELVPLDAESVAAAEPLDLSDDAMEIPIEEVMGTLVKLKEEGKIGAIGLSEIAPYTLRRAAAVHPVAAVQNEYSLWTRLPELGLLQACEEMETTFVAFSPVGRGIFSNRMPVIEELGENDFRRSNPRFAEPNYSLNKAIVSKFNDYATSQGMSPATMANAWVLSRGENIISIPGTKSPEHLAENAKAGDIVLTEAQLAEIERLLPVGFAYGDRYSDRQSNGPERYC